jgi:DNA invertase Pin-like site-specific DNA recombinase/ribosomal protein L17
MNTSELVTPSHLARKALIYIRQSSPHQVLSNQESLRLQYALRQRAISLGWRSEDVEIIDADLGLTATSAQHREGWKELVSQVTLGQVGIILSIEVMRLSRNCSDWYPLLDLCGYKDCLIADGDGVYDPGTPNGRLLLGLKGQLSELELHTIRARMTAGLLNKAKRGELALRLPVGLVRQDDGTVVKDPNREVRERLDLIFSTFLRRKAAAKVLRFFNDHELLIPRRDRFGDLVWKKPSIAKILSVLKNPAYAGAFVYGRSRTTRDPSGKVTTKRLPMDQWRICVKDKYPAYISWETFEQIQAILKDNYAEYDRNKSRGVPRPGSALLHGILYCGECGHKMVVQYKGGTRYLCNYLRQQYRVPVCQNIPGDPIDARVVEAFFQALSPIELDVYEHALAAQKEADEKVELAHRQQLERLRYQAELAWRQFNRVDPDNRLVAAELEQRWEAALRTLRQEEETCAQQQPTPKPMLSLSPELKEAFVAIGQKLPQVWHQEVLTRQNKKALLRCLIDKVVIHRQVQDRVQTRIVWRGGDITTLEIPVPVGSFADLSTAAEMEKIILDLSRKGKNDEEIAEHLTTLGHRSPMQTDRVLPNTVKIIRLKHRIFQKRSQSHPRRINGYLTIPQIARRLDISPHWVYYRIDNGRIQVVKDPETGLYLFPDEPATLEMFKDLKDGNLNNLRFSKEHQDV